MAKVVYQNSSSFVPSRNIPVGIVGYEETDKGLAVKGVDMKEKPDQNGNRTPRLFYFEKNQQTGSTPAAYAQNILTPEKLKNGYKAFGKTWQGTPGSVYHFSRCTPNSDGSYTAKYIENASTTMADYDSKYTTLPLIMRVAEKNNEATGEHSKFVIITVPDLNGIYTTNSEAELADEISTRMANNPNEVLSYHINVYNKKLGLADNTEEGATSPFIGGFTQKKDFTPEQYAKSILNAVASFKTSNPHIPVEDIEFRVVPGKLARASQFMDLSKVENIVKFRTPDKTQNYDRLAIECHVEFGTSDKGVEYVNGLIAADNRFGQSVYFASTDKLKNLITSEHATSVSNPAVSFEVAAPQSELESMLFGSEEEDGSMMPF